MQSNKMGGKVIVWPVLACLLVGTVNFLQAKMASGEGKPLAVIRGTVRSTVGNSLYGILVKARGEGKNYATSVFTDGKGNYEFPPLPAGKYEVSVGTEWKASVQLGASAARQDFSVQLGTGFMNQTTGTSWLRVIPGREEEKLELNWTCTRCHSLVRVINFAPKSPEGWAVIVKKMNSIDSMGRPLKTNEFGEFGEYDGLRERLSGKPFSPEEMEGIVQSLARNIKPELKERYMMEALVRPTGEAARAVFTEWDLPHKMDNVTGATADSRGIIWYTSSASNAVGRLDPRTAEFQEWPYSVPKAGLHDIMVDKKGNVWPTSPHANRIIKFDVETHKFTDWAIPSEFHGRRPHTADFAPDGNYWVTLNSGSVVKLDPGTGKFAEYPTPVKAPRVWPYGLTVDQTGNVWYIEHIASKIVKIDSAGKMKLYSPPTEESMPRRIQVDSKGNLWFAESHGDKIGMLDPVTEKFYEYDTGLPGGHPYFIKVDKFDKVWFDLMNGNMAGKFDPQTKKFVFYLLPTPDSFGRDASFDYTTTPYSIVFGAATKPMILRMYVR